MKRDFATKLTCNLGDIKWFIVPDFRTGEEDNSIFFPLGNINVGKIISISGANDMQVSCTVETIDGKKIGIVQEMFFNSLPEVLNAISKVSDGVKYDWVKAFTEKVDILYHYEILFGHGYDEIMKSKNHEIKVNRCLFSLGQTNYPDVTYHGESVGETYCSKKLIRAVDFFNDYVIIDLKKHV